MIWAVRRARKRGLNRGHPSLAARVKAGYVGCVERHSTPVARVEAAAACHENEAPTSWARRLGVGTTSGVSPRPSLARALGAAIGASPHAARSHCMIRRSREVDLPAILAREVAHELIVEGTAAS